MLFHVVLVFLAGKASSYLSAKESSALLCGAPIRQSRRVFAQKNIFIFGEAKLSSSQ